MKILLKLWLLAVLTSTSVARPPNAPQEEDRSSAIAETTWLGHAATALSVVDAEAWTMSVAHFFRVLQHADNLYTAAASLPDLDASRVIPMVLAAIAEETPSAHAELLVALAWGESRFEQSAQPLCGVLQVNPIDIGRPMSDCTVWRNDLRLAVRAGVAEIEMMLADHRVAGDLKRALLYRACGNKAFDGTCAAAKYAWVEDAIARYHQIEHAVTRAASV